MPVRATLNRLQSPLARATGRRDETATATAPPADTLAEHSRGFPSLPVTALHELPTPPHTEWAVHSARSRITLQPSGGA